LGISYITTILNTIAAKMMNIDPRLIVKADIVKKYIMDLWTKNELNTNILEEHIINNPQDRTVLSTILRPNDRQIQTQPDTTVHVTQPPPIHDATIQHIQPLPVAPKMPEEETEIQEIDMAEPEPIAIPIQDYATTVIAEDIKDVPDYKTRTERHNLQIPSSSQKKKLIWLECLWPTFLVTMRKHKQAIWHRLSSCQKKTRGLLKLHSSMETDGIQLNSSYNWIWLTAWKK
jgi:hypothetical protein